MTRSILLIVLRKITMNTNKKKQLKMNVDRKFVGKKKSWRSLGYCVRGNQKWQN